MSRCVLGVGGCAPNVCQQPSRGGLQWGHPRFPAVTATSQRRHARRVHGTGARSCFPHTHPAFLLSPPPAQVVDIEALKELSWSGIPPDLRPDCWRLLLGYLPPNRERRMQVLLCGGGGGGAPAAAVVVVVVVLLLLLLLLWWPPRQACAAVCGAPVHSPLHPHPSSTPPPTDPSPQAAGVPRSPTRLLRWSSSGAGPERGGPGGAAAGGWQGFGWAVGGRGWRGSRLVGGAGVGAGRWLGWLRRLRQVGVGACRWAGAGVAAG